MFKSPIPKEVQEEILNKVKAGESVSSVATSYGISNRTIYGWLGRKALNSVSAVEYNRVKKENAQLKEIVGILTFELEKLKKRSTIEIIRSRLFHLPKTLLSSLFNISRKSLYLNSNK